MLQRFEFPYPPAKENRILHVYLPDDYEWSGEKYPVLYMFDGHNIFVDQDATYGKSWGMKQFLDNWHKKLIVVGLECCHTGNNRLKEYSPYTFRSQRIGTIKGIGQKTMEWIVNDVKPYIDSHYRTWSHREATAIGGSSMGGMMALYAALKYNKVFSKFACVSPSISFAPKKFAADAKAATIEPDTKIFFSWGTEEVFRSDKFMTRNILSLEHVVLQKGADTWLYHQQGGHHCEADWEKQVPTWMDFFWIR